MRYFPIVRNLRMSAWAILLALLTPPHFAWADGAGPLLKLLQSGRLPAERQPAVVEMVCNKGNAQDLAYVFSQVLDPKAYPADLRLKALVWLSDAAKINKVVPEGDLSSIKQLLADEQAMRNPAFAIAAMRLASQWHVSSVKEELQRIALAEQTDEQLRIAAVESLTVFGGPESRSTLVTLAGPGRSIGTRFLAISALAGLDLDSAAKMAASALAQAKPTDDPTALIQAFLDRKQGPQKLAAALGQVQLPADVAKLALRTMYAAGRSDAALSDLLSKGAGIAVDAPPPTGEELARIVAAVVEKGDAVRGERVFRRGDVNCMKCHSVSGGGGTVGPDLSPVGGTSPVEYIVNSILNPNLAIKEQYLTKNIITSDGRTLSGIVVNRNDQQVQLKDAAGAILTIATADIDEEVEGKSLMPQGLTKFLTNDEFQDLAKFVSELGKPGPFALRTTPTVQRWRVLRPAADQVAKEVPNIEFLRELVLAAPAEQWSMAFGKVAGSLPLDELRTGSGDTVLYLQGVVNVVEAGPVGVRITSTEPAHAWLDTTPFDSADPLISDLPVGPHTLTIRVSISRRPSPELKAEFFKPQGSAAQFSAQ